MLSTLSAFRDEYVEHIVDKRCRAKACTTCDKHGKCKLQKLAYQLGVNKVRFENHREVRSVDFSSPSIVRDPNKCILCGCCVRACAELQGIGVLGFAHRGTDAIVTPAFNRNMAETDCVGCGQCRVVCPTGALTIRHNMTEVWQALGDKNTPGCRPDCPRRPCSCGRGLRPAQGRKRHGQDRGGAAPHGL